MTTIPKREAELKRALVATLKRRFFVQAHSEARKYGVPDLSVSGNGRTTWYELKHATPNFTTQGVQEITCLQLAKYSFCRYIIYYEWQESFMTYIVHPSEVYERKGKIGNIAHEDVFFNHNHHAVLQYITDEHFGRYKNARA